MTVPPVWTTLFWGLKWLSSTLTAADVGGVVACAVKLTGPASPVNVALTVWMVEPPIESVGDDARRDRQEDVRQHPRRADDAQDERVARDVPDDDEQRDEIEPVTDGRDKLMLMTQTATQFLSYETVTLKAVGSGLLKYQL